MKRNRGSAFCLIFYLIDIFLCNETTGHIGKVQQLSKTITQLISSLSVNVLDGKQQTGGDKISNEIIITNIEKKVEFELFNELVPDGIFIENSEDIKSTNFIRNQPIKVITHGWLSGGSQDMCQTIKDQYLASGRVNVLIVHWDFIALSYLYLFVVKKLKFIAEYYANFMTEFIVSNGLDPGQIHLIGHSLGAHLSGQVGKRLASKNLKVGRITGLDPAFPGYQEYFGFEKLSRWDARFVDVIHTCGGTLGIMDPLGHVDFYPNGGSNPMPGCNNFWSQKQCSHSRSWQYFVESITHPFVAVDCESFDSFRNGKCSNDSIELGNNISTNARGSFFFSTSDSSPYTLGQDGLIYIPPKMLEETESKLK